MRAAAADHLLDRGQIGRLGRRRGRRGLRVAHIDIGHQLGDRGADRGPVRLGIVARPGQRLAQRLQAALVPQGR